MKIWHMAALVGALAIVADASAQVPPPVVAQVQVPLPPPSPAPAMQRDGPYHLLLHARIDARERKAHGLHADVVEERGLWYVVYYP